MITICPLDSPQLSTTLAEESHRDPTSAAMENPVPPCPADSPPPAPAPRTLSRAALGEEGAPWFEEG